MGAGSTKLSCISQGEQRCACPGNSVHCSYSFIIGLVAGVLVVESAFFLERKLKVDDPVGAISVHGTCGAWGVISLGLFADGTYLDNVTLG
jgi:ammonia channel protein AmtB